MNIDWTDGYKQQQTTRQQWRSRSFESIPSFLGWVLRGWLYTHAERLAGFMIFRGNFNHVFTSTSHVMRVMTVITIMVSRLAVWRSECVRTAPDDDDDDDDINRRNSIHKWQFMVLATSARGQPPARILSCNKSLTESLVCLIISEVEMEDASGWRIAAKSIWACH